MSKAKKVTVSISSVIDGTEIYREYDGEYQYMNNAHNIAYTDRSGNIITKNALQTTESAMLLHRTGGFSGDMLFDMQTDTAVSYGAFNVGGAFMLHTYEYSVAETDDALTIAVSYGLNDGKDAEISDRQSITVKFKALQTGQV